MKKTLNSSNFRTWLAIVGTATLILGAAYAMVQQSTRRAANDAPIARAQAAKQLLESGAAPSDVVPTQKIDLKENINVFVIVTDKDRHVQASSAQLKGQTPLPPIGVFKYAKAHGADTLTWQPADNVRIASHTLAYKDGYIIAGQSLDPAENRQDTYGLLALAAWLAVLVWVTVVLLFPL